MSDDEVFGDLFLEQAAAEFEPGPEPATATKPKKGVAACSLVFDIETGARPWEEIEPFYCQPPHPGEFDESLVRYGNTKDPAKRREKLEEAREKHAAMVAKWLSGNEEARAECLGKAALSPLTGRVLAIGYLNGVCGLRLDHIDNAVGGEHGLLSRFWECYGANRHQGRLVGHNIYGFDLPFLVRRSWLLGVDVPGDVLRDGRYWAKTFVDTMAAWGCGVYGERVSLDSLASYFGAPGKLDGVTGADFARLYYGEPEDRAKSLDYLEADLRATWAVANRMGVL